MIDLSIVIPVYNEQLKIGNDLRGAADFLTRHRLRGEIIVADDGSQDASAAAAAATAVADVCTVRVLRLHPHRGKGHALRHGMMQTRGEIILFIDSGSCIPWEEVMRGMQLIQRGACDIAHASRRLPHSVILRRQSPARRVSAWLFRHFFSRCLGLPRTLSDTQAGLKVYRGELGRALYRACTTDGFLFDAEIILRAERAQYRMCEFPVTWTSDPDSRLRLRRMPLLLIEEAFRLKRLLRREWNAENRRPRGPCGDASC